MELVMQPFIFIYHIVAHVFAIPRKILHYAYSGFLAIIDHFSLRKDRGEEARQAKEDEAIIAAMIPQNIKGFEELNGKAKEVAKEPIFSYRYKAKSSNGRKIKGTFESTSIEEARTFLTNEGYEILDIAPRKFYDIDINIGGKFKAADLSFALTQLSTYIKAGIPLIDSVRILEKQSEKSEHRKVYQKIVYELLKGENLSTAMDKQEDKFPKFLVNMIKTAELTGDLTSVLDDMADYYTSKEETRRQMISAMTYPVVVLIIAIGVLIFILVSIVPKFVQMYADNNATMPKLTLAIMSISTFITEQYILLIIIIVAIVLIFYLLYKHNVPFRHRVQVILMHLPVANKVIIYNEVYNFTKTFASLLNHGVFIVDSMAILSKITKNEVYKRLINRTLINLNKGIPVSEAFKGSWAFPVAAYEMIVTGENTGQLGVMMDKVADYYQVLHKNLIKQMQSLLEPIMIGFLAFIVGTILLAVVMAMFDIYSKIR